MTATNRNLESLLETLLAGDPRRAGRALGALPSASARIDPVVVEKAISTAALLLVIGRADQACLMLESLRGCCPDQPMLLNNLAYAHVASGRLDQAVALWERAAVMAPQDTLIRSNLVHARRRKRD